MERADVGQLIFCTRKNTKYAGVILKISLNIWIINLLYEMLTNNLAFVYLLGL